ncbi:MAG: ABC transporter permease subunit [Chloroflexi bacterium]|nr:ABC transporter permease subunit [Chloroflexota bacterium]
MNATQILTMARYEVLMAFRRRSLVILLILFLVSLTFFANVSSETNQTSVIALPGEGDTTARLEDLNQLPPEAIPEWMRGVDLNLWYRSGGVSTAMIAGAMIMAIAIVMFSNESIPLDRQYKVRELLDALPLPRTSYLAGKLLGVWAGLLAISLAAALFSAVVFRVLLGPYDLRFLALLWLFFELPLVLLSGALAVLLTSWMRSRRGAVLMSLLVLPVAIILVVLAVPSLSAVGVYVHPAYAFYILLTPDETAVAVVNERIADTVPILLGAMAVSWVLAYGWQRLREGQ